MPGHWRQEVIVGRDDELALLDANWARTRHGQGCVVVLAGEPAIGKTQLARAASDHIRREGGLTACGRAVNTESASPFRPLSEALCSLVRRVGLPPTAELAPFRPLLGRFIPEWASAVEPIEISTVALGEAVLRFARAVAPERGCALVLEDLHWADPDTMAVVEYLADNVNAIPVMCIITTRDDEASLGLDVLRRLAARRTCTWHTLKPLPPEDVAAVVSVHLGVDRAPESALTVVEPAAGVPLLIKELLDTAISERVLVLGSDGWQLATACPTMVPSSHSDSVRRRLARLEPQAARVIRAAAAVGVFDDDVLAAAAGVDQQTLATSIDAAIDAGLVVVDGKPISLRFRHALTADAVRALQLPAERTALARQALFAVANCHPELPGDWCEVAADLSQQAGDPHQAAIFLHELGGRSLESGELTSAGAAFRRALELATPGSELDATVQEDIVEAFTLAGDYTHASEIGIQLLDRLTTATDPTKRWVRIHLRLARAAAAATCWTEARAHLQAARSEASAADLALTCRLAALDALIALGEDDAQRAEELATQAWALAEQESLPSVACEALEVLGRCRRPTDLDGAVTAFADAYELATKHDLRIWRVRAMHELGIVDLLRTVNIDRLSAARELAAELGAVATQAAIELNLCAGLFLRGDDRACVAASTQTAELADRYDIHHVRAAALRFAAMAYARAGNQAEAERALASAAGGAAGDASFLASAASVQAMLAFVADDRLAALRHLDPAGLTTVSQVRSQDPAVGWWALLRAIDADGAGAAINAVRPVQPVNVIVRGFLHFADAILLGRAGCIAEAESALSAGSLLLTEVAWLRHFGLRWVAEAALVDDWGQPESWLRGTEAFFTEAGQERLAAACRSLLRRAGVPVPRRRADWAELPTELRRHGLTVREYEVLTLLAEGLPNAVMAQRLYLSPRTVERHIANICVKVGLQRRSQLVALASRTLASSTR